jgi:nucleoside-diphosphate-sugar epimerase
LPPGSKGPRIKGWPSLKLDKPTFHKMAANGSADAGIGVLARYTPAIDVDILDEVAAQEMSELIDEIFAGQALMTRTGRAPKFLIPFRSDDPFKKLTSSVYTDGENDHKVEILGDGQQVRHYTYGGDLAAGIVTAMEHPDALNEDFNLSTAEGTTVRELAGLIWRKVKGDVPLRLAHDDPFEHDVQRRIPATGKAKRVLGFEAATPLDVMLDEVITWIARQG